ncbi:DUF262 domain-containing protein [Apilactobacillus kunkeei]|nr:DUF262 domain-containing protein [Apilactobacillus kunkeei]
MSDYTVTTATVSSLKDHLLLPKFQRGYVWSGKMQLELIKSLHNGYPFGSLLTYRKGNESEDRLLDGQQRWTTIIDFKNNKAKYFKKLEPDLYEETYTELNGLLEEKGDKISTKEFDSLLSSNNNDMSSRADLSDLVDDLMQEHNFGDKEPRDIRDLIKSLQSKIKSYLNVEDIQIPIIQYTGSEANIAEVFENLNKGGVGLNKYEIFAAAWNHTELRLGRTDLQDELLNEIKKFYLSKLESAEQRGLVLDGFSEDEFTTNRCINLYELGVGIGKMVQKRLRSLIDNSESDINQMGFGLLGVAAGIDPKKLGTLIDKNDFFKDNIENILKKSINISVKLSSIFDKLLRQNSKKNNDVINYERSVSTAYKTLSYFASLWDVDEGSEKYIRIVNNIPVYYVYDFVGRSWGNAGDTRLFEYYPQKNIRTYLRQPDQDDFYNKFKSWILDENTLPENFSGQVKSLATIHSNLTYLSDSVSFGDPLEVEHIFPKARVRNISQSKEIILGRLGNAMYLPKKLNNGKKKRTLYEVENFSDYKELIDESIYPTENDFQEAFEDLKNGNLDTINEKMLNRSYKVAKSIINKLLNTKF